MMNSIMGLGPGRFCGLRSIEDLNMVDAVEDWSEVRSPSRARRRRKRGFRQRIKTIWVPKKVAYKLPDGSLVMHPETRRALERESAKDQEQRDTEAFLRKDRPAPDPRSPWRFGISPAGPIVAWPVETS